MPNTANISERILIAFAATSDMRLAWESVFGAGSYEKVAAEIYDALCAKAASCLGDV